MPKYTYRCPNCGIEFNEKLDVKDSDKEINCIVCGEVADKIIKGVNIIRPTGGDYCGKLEE